MQATQGGIALRYPPKRTCQGFAWCYHRVKCGVKPESRARRPALSELPPPPVRPAMAEEAGLDLVEISPNAEPPVCKIMDFGKFKYETQKREAEARKKQKIIEIKEIKFRPGTDTHDYDVKMRSVLKFLGEGDKVKVTLRFRGREMAHQDLGLELLNRVAADVVEHGKIEAMPKLEGRQMVMMIGPK